MSEFPFGNSDWAKAVLWDELPESDRIVDEKSGGHFYNFITCLMPSFEQLQAITERTYEGRISARTIRPDLIRYLASRFGIKTDLAEPEAYQRMNIEIAARWRLIKGKKESYEILARIHGFDVIVNEIWWDGEDYVTSLPMVSNEQLGVVE